MSAAPSPWDLAVRLAATPVVPPEATPTRSKYRHRDHDAPHVCPDCRLELPAEAYRVVGWLKTRASVKRDCYCKVCRKLRTAGYRAKWKGMAIHGPRPYNAEFEAPTRRPAKAPG